MQPWVAQYAELVSVVVAVHPGVRHACLGHPDEAPCVASGQPPAGCLHVCLGQACVPGWALSAHSLLKHAWSGQKGFTALRRRPAQPGCLHALAARSNGLS